MIEAVEKAGKLLFKDDNVSDTVSSWKDPDVLKRLKCLAK